MNYELLFSISFAILPAWWLLTFFPKWSWTDKIVQQIWIPALLACFYLALFIVKSPRPEGAGFTSLNALVLLYSRPDAALISWVHFLTMDLFVGAWQVRDARRLKIHPALVAPCLFLTFGFGPLGLLLYFVIRASMCRKVSFPKND